MISSVRGVFRPFWAILATVLKETKVRESTHIAYWAPGIERLNTCWKRLSSSSSQSNQTELKRHFDRGCPGWLQFPQRRTTPLMRRRRGRPCGAAATSCSFLPCLSFAKQGGGKHLSSSSMFASAGSLIRSVFKTSAASMNFAARNQGFESTAHSRMRSANDRLSNLTGVFNHHSRNLASFSFHQHGVTTGRVRFGLVQNKSRGYLWMY